MNRREFMKLSAALLPIVKSQAASGQLPTLTAEAIADLSNHLLEHASPEAGGCYWMFLHPKWAALAREIRAREKWRIEWRRARLERQGIVETHGQRWHGPRLGWYEPVEVEIGRFEGVRILQTESA